MTSLDSTLSSVKNKVEEKKLISNKVFAMIIFIFTEIMFFTALISAFIIIKGDEKVAWAIPPGVKLPVLATAYNTLILITSGVLLFLVGKKVQSKNLAATKTLLAWATALGAFFVLFQGFEWLQLISYGLTMGSSIFGACFFLLIGTHGLHAFAGVLSLIYLYAISKEKLCEDNLMAAQIFWFFVVGLWPLLYVLVYFQ